MVREFEGQAARKGRRSIFKEAAKCAEEFRLKLDLEHVQKIKTDMRKCQIKKLEDEVRNQQWQGRLVTARQEDERTQTGVSGSSQSARTAHHTIA